MTPGEIDRILSSEDMLEPSSHFAIGVMEAVRAHVAEPPALRFPWVRFGAGLAASGVMAAAGAVLLSRWEPALAVIAAISPELGYAAAVALAGLGFAALTRLRSS